jgi:hypothetical protein
MNLATETLQFVAAGDLQSITLTFQITSLGSPVPGHIDLTIYGSSDGITYSTLLGETTVVSKGSSQIVTETACFPVTSDMVSHGARIYLRTDTSSLTIINIGLITARIHKAR